MAENATTPILILSGHRPNMLAATLEALATQRGVDAARRQVFLLQDGGRDAVSGDVHASPAMLRACLDLFCRVVPHGLPLLSYVHLGPAQNFERAARLAFEQMGAADAVFLDDEIVPGPWYLRMIDKLLDLARGDDRIGAVAAYGDQRAARADQMPRASKLMPMRHWSGVGLLASQWQRMRPRLDAQIASGKAGTDYGAAALLAAREAGMVPLTTTACFARLTGREAARLSDSVPERLGFGGAEVIQEDGTVPALPSEAEFAEWLGLAPAPKAPPPTQAAAAAARSGPAPTTAAPAAPVPEAAALSRIRSLANEGRFDAAEQLAVEWLTRSPDWRDGQGHPGFLKELVRLSLVRGRLGQARHLADRLTERLPANDPLVLVLFARAYQKSGATAAAYAEWQAVLARQPGNKEAQAAVEELRPRLKLASGGG